MLKLFLLEFIEGFVIRLRKDHSFMLGLTLVNGSQKSVLYKMGNWWIYKAPVILRNSCDRRHCCRALLSNSVPSSSFHRWNTTRNLDPPHPPVSVQELRLALSVPIGPAVFLAAVGFVLAVCHSFPVVLSGLLLEWKVDEGETMVLFTRFPFISTWVLWRARRCILSCWRCLRGSFCPRFRHDSRGLPKCFLFFS
jgi:hypothetical protein